MKDLRFPSRILIGCVFIFSGFVKAVDPLGSTYKFSDYFEAFGMDFLSPLGFIFAIILSSSELLIGLSLFLGLRMKITAWALMIYMSFFLVLTLVIALTDPVSDCGCFGDALILTNWQTFWKNIFFYIPTLIVFVERNNFPEYFKHKIEWGIVILLVVIAIGINLHGYRNLPIIDFRPYKVGTNIPESMSIPEGEKPDRFETILIYEKDDVQQEFTVENIPYEDTTWKWVETKNILVEEGYEPPIHDFSLTSVNGIDITNEILSDQNYSLLIVAYNLEETSEKGMKKIYEFVKKAQDQGINVYGMTASTWDEINDFKKQNPPPFDFYTCDDITLKTMVRSNPGVVLLRNGYILNKWHFRNLPGDEFFKGDIQTKSMIQTLKNRNRWLASFYMLLVVLLFMMVQFTKNKKQVAASNEQ